MKNTGDSNVTSSPNMKGITNIMYIMFTSSAWPNLGVYNKVAANTNIKTIEKSKILF